MNKLDNVIINELGETLSNINQMRELMNMINSKVDERQWLKAYLGIDYIENTLATALKKYPTTESEEQ